jgi:hypothetical protein
MQHTKSSLSPTVLVPLYLFVRTQLFDCTGRSLMYITNSRVASCHTLVT